MLLINAVLSDCGVYDALLNIINQYAWESHMEEKWKDQYRKGIKRLIELADYVNQATVCPVTCSEWHLQVLVKETKQSYLIRGYPSPPRAPWVDRGKKQMAMWDATKAKFEANSH